MWKCFWLKQFEPHLKTAFILERNPMNLLNVEKLSLTCHTSLNVEVRLERNPVSEEPLARWQIHWAEENFYWRRTSEYNKTSLSIRKFILGEKACNILCMIEISLEFYSLLYIWKVIHTGPSDVRNVEIPSSKSKSSFIKKFILERNLVNVGKLPFRCHTSVSREFVVGEPPLPVKYVGKSSATNRISPNMNIFIIERNLLNVMNVERLSMWSHSLLYIRDPTLERNPTNVMNVEKLSNKMHPLPNMWKLIQKKNLMSELNVGNQMKCIPYQTRENSFRRKSHE